MTNNEEMSADLEVVVDVFRGQHRECLQPAAVADQCVAYSEAFLRTCGEHAVDAELVHGFQWESPGVIAQGHTAVLADGLVVDWTARQFDPLAPVPVVQSLENWRETWARL